MAYREAYQPKTKTIVDRDGNVLADMSAKSIIKNFHIPTFEEIKEEPIEDGKVM